MEHLLKTLIAALTEQCEQSDITPDTVLSSLDADPLTIFEVGEIVEVAHAVEFDEEDFIQSQTVNDLFVRLKEKVAA